MKYYSAVKHDEVPINATSMLVNSLPDTAIIRLSQNNEYQAYIMLKNSQTIKLNLR